jgi:hypothetical protein
LFARRDIYPGDAPKHEVALVDRNPSQAISNSAMNMIATIGRQGNFFSIGLSMGSVRVVFFTLLHLLCFHRRCHYFLKQVTNSITAERIPLAVYKHLIWVRL